MNYAHLKKSRGPLRVRNATRSATLATSARVANSYFTRLMGLMGVAALPQGEGLVILPCGSVHSHFMRFAIDVLYLNEDLRIVGIDASLVPWRFGHFYKGARFVIELPAGTAKATGTGVGDQVETVEGE